MALHLVRLIVLRKIKFQEADLIVHGINSQGMRVSFLAKSALKSKKRFGGGVFDPFHYIEVGLARPPKNYEQLLVVQEARLLKDFEGIKKNYDCLQIGFQILEMVYKVIQVGDAHGEALYQLLGNALTALDVCETANLEMLRVSFTLKFLMQQGVLQAEAWMQPFLSTPIRESIQNLNFIDLKDKVKTLDLVLQQYLLTAQV
jgi:DNA repair protein RecO (recombination protein O)